MSYRGLTAEAGHLRPYVVAPSRARTRAVSRGLGLLVPAAVVLPLLLMGGGAWLSWRQAWRSAEAELTRTADAGAEYARRVLDGLLLRADRANSLLAGLSDEAVRAREADLHAAFRALAERTGDAGALHAFAQGRAGASLASGEIFPVPPPSVTFEEREYARALRAPGGPPVHLGEVFVGQVLARPFFVVARRREGGGNGLPPGEYDGLVAASADVNAVGAGLLRLVPGGAEGSPDVLALVRADGRVLARSSGMAGPLPPLPRTNAVAQGILGGRDGPDREVILRPSGVDHVPRLAALRRVEGWPAFISVARPRSAIAARWREAVAMQLAFGIPAALALIGLAMLARRSARDLAQANDGLEWRVAERTGALEERDARLRLAMATAALGIVEWDLDAGTMRVDAGTEAISRGLLPAGRALPVDGPERAAWVARIHPEDQRRREAQVAALRAGAVDTIQGDYRVRLPPRDGETGPDEAVWITYRGGVSARSPASGRVMRFIDVVQDVTDRKRTEEALVAGQARLRAALHAARLGVWERHLPSATASWDERAAEIWDGLTPERCAPGLAGWLDRVHPEDRAAREADILAVVAPGGQDSYGIEFRFRCADGRWKRVAVHGAAVERDPATGRAVRIVGVVQDLTEMRAAEAALRESEERLRLATEGGGVGIWELDLASGLGRWSRESVAIFGIGRAAFSAADWVDAIHPEDRARVAEAWRRTVEEGAPYEIEFRTAAAALDGGARWVLSRGGVERGPDGAPLRGVGVMLDVTTRRRAEEQRELLLREVDHRAKNALAVVQAALRLTPKDDAAAYARAVEGRVRALARAHTLLAEGRWQGAALRALVEAELAPFLPPGGGAAAPRVEVDGPALTLAPAAAQALSMALHELATNAVKYGALSAPGGRVAVSWVVDGRAEALRLRWHERGGPPVGAPPSHRGFGSRVVEATVGDQLGGLVERRWEAEGLVCELTVPLAKASATGGVAAAQ